MEKLKTGVSTNLDFIRIMKEKGQTVNAEFPAETLRKQLDDLGDVVDVTFLSTNETVLEAVNDDSTKHEDAGTAEDLKNALNDPEVGYVTLTADIALDNTLTIDRDITIDGGGKTVTADGKNVFKVKGDNINVKLDNINIEATGNGTAVRIGDKNLGDDKVNKVTIGKNASITADTYGVTVFGENSEVDVYGKLALGENAGPNEGFVISGNGAAAFAGKTTINIYEGAELDADKNGFCIYQPQDGIINVYGGNLHGASVFGIKSGELNVTGGTLTANGQFVDPVPGSFDGKAPTGDVIAVEVNKSYTGGKEDKNIKINVTNTDINSENAYRIREVNINAPEITIEVEGDYAIKSTIAENVNVYDDHAIVLEEPEVEETNE